MTDTNYYIRFLLCIDTRRLRNYQNYELDMMTLD